LPQILPQPVLVVEDNAAGLSPQQLRRALGVAQRASVATTSLAEVDGDGGASAAGQLPALVHAVLRLGSLALLLTKQHQQGASVALLSCHSGCGAALHQPCLEVAVLDFDPDGRRQLAPSGSGASEQPTSTAAAASNDWQTALSLFQQHWPGLGSEDALLLQLAGIADQGTRLLVTQLRVKGGSMMRAAGPVLAVWELDWVSDPADIRASPGLVSTVGDSQGEKPYMNRS
jgi:hypothetical protein